MCPGKVSDPESSVRTKGWVPPAGHHDRVEREREQRVAELLEENVRVEIFAASALNDIDLTQIQVQQLARAVTTSVLYAFAVDWAPRGVKPGDPHTWQSSGRWFARCATCLQDSPGSASRDEAVHWAGDHSAHRPA